jgi:5-hydroxyisourate hydrolase
MSLSTHVLDTANGKPAANIAITLFIMTGEDSWRAVGHGMTDHDGRCKGLLGHKSLEAATYKLRFATASYFASLHLAGLYPYVEIIFTVRDPGQHFHIPLLLTANGYTTYRGS